MKIILVFLIFFYSLQAVSFAVPSLEIGRTTFDCQENFINKGFDSCSLRVPVSIEDYSINSKYNRYSYNVRCIAAFNYWEHHPAIGFLYSGTMHETGNTIIYGISFLPSYIDIKVRFISINPVIKVAPKDITCKVTDIY